MTENISRRYFLEKFICFSGTTAVASLMRGNTFCTEIQGKIPDIAAVKGDTEKSLNHAIDLLGGINKFVRPGDTVLLKPNISFPNPKTWGTTTSPEVVRTLSEIVIDAGAKRVFVADNTMREGTICFDKTGLTSALEKIEKVKIIPLQRENLFTEVLLQNGKAIKSVKIAKLLQRCNVFINLPCAKSHSATEVSFGLKNLMGIIWDRAFFHSGTDIHTAIADLAAVVRPHLTILDATRALTSGGPTGPGKVETMNTIIAGTDPLAVDSYAVSLTNWNKRMLTPESVLHLNHASKIGVGEIDLKKLNIKEVTI